MAKLIDRTNQSYMDRLYEIEQERGKDLADLIDTAIDFLEYQEDDDMVSLFLAALFAMPLPHPGAADELVDYLQSLGRR